MWQVIELAEGAPQTDALLAQVAGVTIDRDALLWLVETAAARGLHVPGSLTHELELGPEERPSSLYAAEVWGRRAEEAAPGEMYVDENGQLIWNLERPNIQIRSRGVHHDRSAMIASPRGGTVAEVSYDPEPEDRALDDHSRGGGPTGSRTARRGSGAREPRRIGFSTGGSISVRTRRLPKGRHDSNGSGAGCARGCQSRTWPEARSGRSSERYSGSTAPQPESWTGTLFGCDASHTGRSISRQSLLNTRDLTRRPRSKATPMW